MRASSIPRTLALLAWLAGMGCSSPDQPSTVPWCHETSGPGAIDVGARFATCPEITSYSVQPLRLRIGDTAQLSGTARDIDSNNLTFAWSAASGTVASPTSPVTTYQCSAVGIIKLTFIVSDGTCQDAIEAAIDCIP